MINVHAKYFMHGLSIYVSPSQSNLGRQPCWVARLLVCVSGVSGRDKGDGYSSEKVPTFSDSMDLPKPSTILIPFREV